MKDYTNYVYTCIKCGEQFTTHNLALMGPYCKKCKQELYNKQAKVKHDSKIREEAYNAFYFKIKECLESNEPINEETLENIMEELPK